jgi:hypothetical protein
LPPASPALPTTAPCLPGHGPMPRAPLAFSSFACPLLGGAVQALKALYVDFADWCKAHKLDTPPRAFSLNLIGRRSKKTFPMLSGDWKASAIKPLSVWLSGVLEREAERTGCEHNALRLCLSQASHARRLLPLLPQLRLRSHCLAGTHSHPFRASISDSPASVLPPLLIRGG